MKFRDQLVRCGACGTQFVYTVREQRRRAEKGQTLDSPAFCHECRGADVRLAEADSGAATKDDPVPPAAERRTSGPRRRTEAPRQRSAGNDDKQGRGRAPRPKRERGSGSRAPRGRGGRAKARTRSGGARRGPSRARRQSRQTELRIRHLGTVKWFDGERGYGFIAQEDGDEVFVHCSAVLADGRQQLEQGQPVEYEIESTDRGLQAVDVVPLA